MINTNLVEARTISIVNMYRSCSWGVVSVLYVVKGQVVARTSMIVSEVLSVASLVESVPSWPGVFNAVYIEVNGTRVIECSSEGALHAISWS